MQDHNVVMIRTLTKTNEEDFFNNHMVWLRVVQIVVMSVYSVMQKS